MRISDNMAGLMVILRNALRISPAVLRTMWSMLGVVIELTAKDFNS